MVAECANLSKYELRVSFSFKYYVTETGGFHKLSFRMFYTE